MDRHQINTTFCSLLEQRRSPADYLPIVGIENEFYVFCNGRHVDFRALSNRLARLEEIAPFFTHRYGCFLSTGSQLSADRSCAEMATAPHPLSVAGIDALLKATVANRNHLVRLVRTFGEQEGGEWRVEGYSTHFNFHFPAPMPWEMCWLLSYTVLPAWALLTERRVSGGVMVRPRPARVELGGEYLPDPAYQRAAILYLAGTWRALARRRVHGELDCLPLCTQPGPSYCPKQRSGLAYTRSSFGGQLYRLGRGAALRAWDSRSASRIVRAQDVLEAYYEFAYDDIKDLAQPDDLSRLDAVIRGDHPLSIEAEAPDSRYYDVPIEHDIDYRPTGLSEALGRSIQEREAGLLWVAPERVSWNAVHYSVWNGDATAWTYVRRTDLPAFQGALEDGVLRDVLDDYTAASGPPRTLGPPGPRRRTGLYAVIRPKPEPMPVDSSSDELSGETVGSGTMAFSSPEPGLREGDQKKESGKDGGQKGAAKKDGAKKEAAKKAPKKPPKKLEKKPKPKKKPKKKKKDQCPAVCTVEVVDRRPGQRKVRIYLPITADPLVPPLEKPAPVNPAVGARGVLLGPGSFFEVAHDLGTASRGMNFEFLRIHRTDVQYDGILGQRWDHTYNKRVVPHPGPPVCRKPIFEEFFDEQDPTSGGRPLDYLPGDATRETHRFVKWEWRTVRWCTGQFEAVVSTFERLPGERFIIQRYAVTSGDPPFGAEPIFYLIRFHDGSRFVLNCHGYLTHIIDRNENRMTFHYGMPYNPSTGYDVLRRIVDTAGRAYVLNYQNQRGIPRIIELRGFRNPNPRTVVFDYTPNVELRSARGPDGDAHSGVGLPPGIPIPKQPNARLYEYDSASRLEKIYNPTHVRISGGQIQAAGDPVVVNTFDGAGRIQTQRWGGTTTGAPAAGGTYVFGYGPLGINSITDRRGVIHRYELRVIHGRKVIRRLSLVKQPIPYQGLQVIGMPAEYPIETDHNDHYEPVRITHPGGLVEALEYETTDSPLHGSDESEWTEREWVERDLIYEDDLARGNLIGRTLTSPRAGDAVKARNWEYRHLFNVVKRFTDEARRVQTFIFNHANHCTSPERNGNPVAVVWPDRTLPDGARSRMIEGFVYTTGGLVETSIDAAGVRTFATYTSAGYLASITADHGGLNLTTSYTHDDHGNYVTVTTPRAHTTTRRYDDRDRLMYTQDAMGGIVESQYDADDQTTHLRRHVIDQDHVQRPSAVPIWPTVIVETKLHYDILGQVHYRVDDAQGRRARTRYVYDGEGLLTRTVLPRGNSLEPRATIDRVYDVRGLPVVETRCAAQPGASLPLPAVHQTVYDAAGYPRAEVDPMGRLTEMETDGHGFVLSITDWAGNQVVRVPTVGGLPAFVLTFGPVGGPTPADASGTGNRLLSAVGFDHDEYGNTIRSTTYAFDRSASLAAGARALETEFWYNPLHQLTVQVNPDGSQVLIRHDRAGRPVLQVDRSGGRAVMIRDANGNIVHSLVTNHPDTDTRLGGQAARTVLTTYVHDPLNRIVQTTNHLNQTARFGYDSRGLYRWSVSPKGAVSEYRYNGLGHQIEVLKHGAASVTGVVHLLTSHDDHGNPTFRYDSRGQFTRYIYDCHDRMRTRIDPDGRQTEYRYLPDGRLWTLVKRDGHVIRHSYDRIGRLSGRHVLNAGAIRGTRAQSFEYDGMGNVTRAVDDNGTGEDAVIIRTYDSLGRIATERQRDRTYTYTYGFENFPQALQYASGVQMSWQADAAGRHKQVFLDGVELASFSYDAIDRISERRFTTRLRATLQAGQPPQNFEFPLVKRIVYDSLNRHHFSKEMVLRQNDPGFQYEFVQGGVLSYDTDGFVSNIVESKFVKEVEYDHLGRTRIERRTDLTGTSPVLRRRSIHSYDGAGNPDTMGIITEGRAGTPTQFTSIRHSASSLNQLTRRDTTTQTGSTVDQQSETFEYHPQGHLFRSEVTPPWVRRGLRLLRYDVLDRLVWAVFLPEGSPQAFLMRFEYDAFSRRTKTIYGHIDPPFQERFGPMVRHYYSEERVIEESRSRVSSDSTGDDIRRYFWGPGNIEMLAFDAYEQNLEVPDDLDEDGIQAEWTGFHCHSDYQGNLVALTQRDFVTGPGQRPVIRIPFERFEYDGDKVTILEFDFSSGLPVPVERSASQTGQPYYFQSSRFDREVYLKSFGLRTYDPDTGRFTTRDPLGSWADPRLLGNGYVFANNNPDNFTDTSGLLIESLWDAASLGVGLYSISQWNESTPWYDKVLDVVGVVVDGAALALPFIPGGVGVGLKAYRAARTVEGAVDVLRNADRVSDAMRALQTGKKVERILNTAQGIDMGLNAARSYARYQETGSYWDAAFTLLAGVGATRSLTQAVRGVCFEAGTPVLTPEGPVSIETVRVGQEVMGTGEDGQAGWVRVTDVQARRTDRIRLLTVERQGDRAKLGTTDEHPIWCVDTQEWLPAARIHPGMRVGALDGEAVVVESSAHNLEEPVTVYNLEISGGHSYFAGAFLILVHNECVFEYVATFLKNKNVTQIGHILADTASEAIDIMKHNPDKLLQKRFSGAGWIPWFLDPKRLPSDAKWQTDVGQEIWRRIVVGNAIQQVTDSILDVKAIEALAVGPLKSNLGFVYSRSGTILRPDWHLEVVDSMYAVFDLSTHALKNKITKYGRSNNGAHWLGALSYAWD